MNKKDFEGLSYEQALIQVLYDIDKKLERIGNAIYYTHEDIY